MGDWVKAEFALARQLPDRDFGCIAGFGPRAAYIVQGDAFVFPKSGDARTVAAQQLLASVVTRRARRSPSAPAKARYRSAPTSTPRRSMVARVRASRS